jgi:Cyclic nucleotide-binding domain
MAKRTRGSVTKQRLLITAQLLSLAAMLLGLQFLYNTTGGTLFAFSTLGPLLVTIAVLLLVGVGIQSLVRRHRLFTFVTYHPGEIIFHQGEEGDAAFFIQSGEVEVLREQEGKEPSVVAKINEGYFGEMALLTNSPRNATVRASTETRLAVLGKTNFIQMCTMMPSAQEDVLKTAQQRAGQEGKR